MKKIVLASAAMGGAALVAFGASGTFAAFTDSGQSGIANAQAGTVYLDVSGQSASSNAGAARTTGNMAPGDVITYVIPVRNAGSLPAFLDGGLVITEDNENTCLAPESRGGDLTCTTTVGDGELSEKLTVVATNKVLPAGTSCSAATGGDQYYPRTTVNTFQYLPAAASGRLELGPGETACNVIVLTLPSDVDNTVQSDTLGFQVNYTLTQK